MKTIGVDVLSSTKLNDSRSQAAQGQTWDAVAPHWQPQLWNGCGHGIVHDCLSRNVTAHASWPLSLAPCFVGASETYLTSTYGFAVFARLRAGHSNSGSLLHQQGVSLEEQGAHGPHPDCFIPDRSPRLTALCVASRGCCREIPVVSTSGDPKTQASNRRHRSRRFRLPLVCHTWPHLPCADHRGLCSRHCGAQCLPPGISLQHPRLAVRAQHPPPNTHRH